MTTAGMDPGRKHPFLEAGRESNGNGGVLGTRADCHPSSGAGHGHPADA